MNKITSLQDLISIIFSMDSNSVISDAGYISLKTLMEASKLEKEKVDFLPPQVKGFIVLISTLQRKTLLNRSGSNYKHEARHNFACLSEAGLNIRAGLEKMGHAVFVDVQNRVPVKELAVAAGLGEIAQNTLFISSKFGPAVQIAILATDIQLKDLIEDKVIQYDCGGCIECMKCCPAKALFNGKIDIQSCRVYRRSLPDGTDCGICLKVCQREFDKRKAMAVKA